ncbi:Negative regulator of mitotic exit [Rhodotorula mucilaginosa]|uniref:Negative regulator of mitotic exit n=1 Tax=Rhodotorula mucilaginosa TaxID=5537 RepID=A0A9P6W4J9_RHOMI|nr:Negative regulator of mitotic exit [Rhodotorula mucilaginosa]
MAIFKSKHKKDQNSASNRADATSGHSSSPSRRGGAGALDSSQNQQGAPLKGSVGRANGLQQHPQAQGAERLYASAGSANSSTINSAPGMHLHDPNGPGYPGPMSSLRHPPANSAYLQQQGHGAGGGGPLPPPPPSHQQQQQHPSSSSSSRPEPTSTSSQHTVLYPWSQRRIALLPSQHLAPLSPGDSPSLAPLSPILGPTSPLPFPRYGHSVNPVATAGSTGDLYIFGGLVQNSVRNDLYVVHANATPNPQQGAATGPVVGVALVETRGEVPGPRVGHASVGVGNVLIVWGGDTKTRPEERQDDGLYLLNLSTRDWTRVKTVGKVPEGRYGHAVAMVGSRFFVFGGQTDDGGFKNDLCFFDLQKLKLGQPSWTFIEPQPNQAVPPPRTGHTCVTFGDSLYIFGGTDGQYHYNDTWQYDLATGVWTELACIGYIPVPREGHAATLVDDVMYVFGGRGVDGKDLEDLAAFKISNHRWFMFQNMGPAPSGRSGHAMATHGSRVLVLGGESYTSGRTDDPSLVHVLDTTKIKYPPDSRPAAQQQQQQLANSASSPPIQSPRAFAGSPPPPPLSPPPQHLPPPIGGSSIPAVRRKPSIPVQMSAANGMSEDTRSRAASPTGSMRDRDHERRGLQSSLGAVAAVAATATGPTAPTSTQFPSSASAPIVSLGSPTQKDSLGAGAGAGTGAKPPTRPARPDDADAFGTSSPATASSSTFGGANPPMGRTRASTLTGNDIDARQRQASGGSEPQQQPPLDAFYYRGAAATQAAPTSTSAQVAPSHEHERVEKLESEKAWLLLEVERLTSGAVPADGAEGAEKPKGLDATSIDRELREALLEMKKELANAQHVLSSHVVEADERHKAAERSQAAALQEAAYARAKLAALEAGSPDDFAKLERERSATLEQKLVEAVATQSSLSDKIAKLESDAAHRQSMRATAEERCEAALARAHEAEQNHSRVFADLTSLQVKAGEHERGIAEHAERNVTLAATAQRLEQENAQLKEAAEAHESSVGQWLAAIAAAEAALLAAHKRNDEVTSLRESAAQEAQSQRERAAGLERELESLRSERDAAQARAEEAERQHVAAREASDSNFALASGGLSQLLSLHRSRPNGLRNLSRSVGDDGGAADGVESSERGVAPEQLSAMQMELDEIKKLHSEAQSRQASLAAEVAQAREREADLQAQLSQARTQLAVIQRQHSTTLDELNTFKSRVAEHEIKSRETARARDAAQIKAGVLHNLLADHGLASPAEDDLSNKHSPITGAESADQLATRVRELEAELASRQHQRQQAEDRVTEHESEVARLRQELDRERSTGVDVRTRADKAQEELEVLQSRHQQLEATHLKAVQYVKGTEKMLRRMKEELNRYKERCEQLDSPERQQEMEHLRAQVGELQTTAETSAREVEQLRQHTAALQNELDKAHRELEETLAVNASLNKELQSALKNPTSPRQGTSHDDLASLQAEFDQAQNRAEWLKRENASLEQRCRTAESKIAILLDHMEGIQNDQYEGESIEKYHDEAAGSQNQAHDPNDHHEWRGAEQQRMASPTGAYQSDEPQRRL